MAKVCPAGSQVRLVAEYYRCQKKPMDRVKKVKSKKYRPIKKTSMKSYMMKK